MRSSSAATSWPTSSTDSGSDKGFAASCTVELKGSAGADDLGLSLLRALRRHGRLHRRVPLGGGTSGLGSRPQGLASVNGLDARGGLEVQHIPNHVLAVEVEVSVHVKLMVNWRLAPALSSVVTFTRECPRASGLIEEDFVDVSADALSTQGGLKLQNKLSGITAPPETSW